MQNFENQFTSLFKECSDRLGEQPEEDLLFLQQLVELIRPEDEEDLSRPTQQFILFLESHPEEREMLAQCLRNLFASKSFVSLLTDVAIPQASDFFFEVKEKIVAKLIPSQPPKNHLAYYFNHIFHQATDSDWIASLSDQQLIKIATLLELSTMRESTSVV